jgi:hypothetical protein
LPKLDDLRRHGPVRWGAMKKIILLAALIGLSVFAVRKLRTG